MSTAVMLDKRHFKAVSEKARELGQTPQAYVESLIDAATLTFDEILAPIRRQFARSGVTEEELGEAVAQARKAIHARSRRKARR